MVQGCTSDAGKSALVTGLCRWLKRRGLAVAPFKPQNMALNSAVTADGGEIGRAQAVQAAACGLESTTDMNPVLLKPESDTGSQVIVQGRALAHLGAAAYEYKAVVRSAVLESYARLGAAFDAILIEGAGSPAEINLRAQDIANMGFAEAVDCPVILVADIDRGGVFAHLVGTLALLSASERARVKGFVINRFRGDLTLLEPGLHWLEGETGKPVLGVLPYLQGLDLEEEDSVRVWSRDERTEGHLRVLVPVLRRISNHTDFDTLRRHPAVDFRFVRLDQEPPPADLVILPGSKSVRADLDALREASWPGYLARHLRYGGKLLGICGGFQMLGRTIEDPLGIESEPGTSAGLGWLDMVTRLTSEKQLHKVAGRLTFADAQVRGYEIHAGVSQGAALECPLVDLGARKDGALAADGQVVGTYLHGLFDQPAAAAALLAWAGLPEDAAAPDMGALREAAIERLADAVEVHLDTRRLLNILGDLR